MCTRPIQVTKKKPDGSFSVYSVPCGKCPECRAKYQSEFAALSVLEADACGTLAFLTLTYDNEHLPINLFMRLASGDYDFAMRDRGSYCYPWQLDDWKKQGCMPLPDDDGGLVCPTLNRKDVQYLMKRFRQDYFRRTGTRLDLRYSCFGEYGEKFHRPHYHLQIFGLPLDEVNRLSSLWKYGYCDVRFVDRFNADGSDAFVKVARYVSKYVSKCEFLPDFVRDGLAEAPRKQASVHFGTRSLDVRSLQNFT